MKFSNKQHPKKEKEKKIHIKWEMWLFTKILHRDKVEKKIVNRILKRTKL